MNDLQSKLPKDQEQKKKSLYYMAYIMRFFLYLSVISNSDFVDIFSFTYIQYNVFPTDVQISFYFAMVKSRFLFFLLWFLFHITIFIYGLFRHMMSKIFLNDSMMQTLFWVCKLILTQNSFFFHSNGSIKYHLKAKRQQFEELLRKNIRLNLVTNIKKSA